MKSPKSQAGLLLFGPKERASVLLSEALQKSGYQEREAPLPAYYRPYDGEYLSLALLPFLPPKWLPNTPSKGPEDSFTLVLVAQVGHLFQHALEWASFWPEEHFLAWKALAELPPVLKVYGDGKPQWKDGEDQDLELFYELPKAPPLEFSPSKPFPFPIEKKTFIPLFQELTSSIQAESWRHYIHRRSPLFI